MTGEDRTSRNEPTDEAATGFDNPQLDSDSLVRFVDTTGTQVAGKHPESTETSMTASLRPYAISNWLARGRSH